MLDDRLEAITHDLLKDHALLDDILAATGLAQRLLDARKAATQEADDEIVLASGLRAGRPHEVLCCDAEGESGGPQPLRSRAADPSNPLDTAPDSDW